MAKLPPDFVKPPAFDSPLRPTVVAKFVEEVHEIVLRMGAEVWTKLEIACAAENTTPGELVERIVTDWLRTREQPQKAPPAQPAATAQRSVPAAVVEEVLGLVRSRLRRLPVLGRFVPSA